jgi:hypothetical protein
MTGNLSPQEIAMGLQKAYQELYSYCITTSDEQFFKQPAADKWSPAQQVKHLITSTHLTHLVFRLPKFIIRYMAGKPNRPSKTYEELVAKYISKLQLGGTAPARFQPKTIEASYGKEKLLKEFSLKMEKLSEIINSSKWSGSAADQYLAKHPLLGRITLRELGYFTIYHTGHHLKSIKQLTSTV